MYIAQIEWHDSAEFHQFALFTTPEEATAQAKKWWDALSDEDHRNYNCYSGVLTRDDLDPDNYDFGPCIRLEDVQRENLVDWCAFIWPNDYPGCFCEEGWFYRRDEEDNTNA